MTRVVLVGGGTAGHVEPALAVGRWLKNHSPEIDLEFIGTKSGVEVELLVDTRIKFHPILKVPFPRKFSVGAIIWPIRFKIAFFQSLKAIRGAKLVIGFGGYVSAPAYLAAKILRIPLIVHEANAMPGMANRFGAHLTDNLLIAFEGARSINNKWQTAKNVGMPIKDEIDNFSQLNLADLRIEFLKKFELNPESKTLLIFGGSIGARQINNSVAEARTALSATGWNVIHAVGGANQVPAPDKSYRATTYISDMTSAYAAADFVIARSGAVTCAELQATGLPALLVPLPIGNGEQIANAKELISSGQAQMISNAEFTPVWLASNIGKILQQAPSRKTGQSQGAAKQIGEIAFNLIRANS